MKRIGFIGLLSLSLCCSCTQESLIEENPVKENTEVRSCLVSFVPSMMEITQGEISGWRSSRTDPLSELATTLSYWDYLDGERIQSDTLSTFSPFSMNMLYGTHHVYFLAHSSEDGVMEGMKYTPAKVTETFWEDFEIEADENLSGEQSVLMERVVSKVMVTVKDAMPSGVAKMRLTVDGHIPTLNLITGNGDASSASAYSITWNIGSEYIGRSGLTFSVFTFTPEKDKEISVKVKIEALSASNEVIYSAEAPSVPLLRNRCTNASCRLFGRNSEMNFSVSNDWNPTLEIEI